MRRPLRLAVAAAFVICNLLFVISAHAADIDYPYGNINLRLPPSEDPFPGLGTYYTALSRGMQTVLWNPASLGKVKLSEAALSTSIASGNYNLSESFKIKELGGSFSVGSGSTSSAGQYGIFYRAPAAISGLTTKEVEILTHAGYATEITGMNFSSALKVNNWITVGFSANSPVETDLSLVGDFPFTVKGRTNLSGQSFNQIQVGTDNKIKYTYTSGGSTTTYESTQAIWSGFLSQEATIPLTTFSEFRDKIKFQSPYVGTIAGSFGNFNLGLNMVPVNASADIDNDTHAVVNSDASDIFIYTPNFDPSNQSEIASWIADQDKYSTSSGYLRKQIKLPAGEIIASSKYRGFYSASTARLDLGGVYDLSDWFSVGFALENFGGSSLNFKGNGRAGYISYRDVDTNEASSLTDLLSPGGKSTINLITNRWVTTDEAGGSKLFLEPEKNYALPRRTRVGFALKRPFLIAVDYEQNQNPFTLPGSPAITVSDLKFLRVGLDLSLLRLGMTFVLKPTLTGANASTTSTVNSLFRFVVLPLRLDAGSSLNLWGYNTGLSFGVNAMPIFSILQMDSQNFDLSKIVYSSLTLGKDAWQIRYLSEVDMLSSASAYTNKAAAADGTKKIAFSDIKFVQTLGVTYRF